MAEWVDGKLKITLRDRWKFSRNKVPKRIMQAYDYVCRVLKGPDSDEIDRERRYQIVGCKYGDLPVAACCMPAPYFHHRYYWIVFDKGTEFLEEDALVGVVAHEMAHSWGVDINDPKWPHSSLWKKQMKWFNEHGIVEYGLWKDDKYKHWHTTGIPREYP